MSPVEGNPSLNDESATDDSQSMHEAQLNAAMKRLKLIHVKSRLLRDIIPRIIEPLVQRHPSPDVMFNAFTKGVSDAQTEIKEFVDLMRDEESKQVFAQADKSREVNPFGIKPWKHHDYPDWFRIDKE